MESSVSTKKREGALRKPSIAIPEEELERLSRLAESASRAMPEVAEYLQIELDRAKIVPLRRADHVVRMGTSVEYRDEVTGKSYAVTLVYPGESDIAQGRVSVLTPIGAALLGLSVGQTIDWTTRRGETRQLTIVSVSNAAVSVH